MPKDELYVAKAASTGSFRFDDAVAEVFPDMLERSIPGYAASLAGIGDLAARFAQPQTNCYDLGCSLGATALAMRHSISHENCRIIAVDNSPSMVARCRQAIAADSIAGPEITVVRADIGDVEVSAASVVVMNYTLQFVEPEQRGEIIDRISRGTVPGGILVLSEKVVDEDPALEDIAVDLHHRFKRRNEYSDREIARKRKAIENVLVPDGVETHFARLESAGYRHFGIWLKHFNFVSIIAIR